MFVLLILVLLLPIYIYIFYKGKGDVEILGPLGGNLLTAMLIGVISWSCFTSCRGYKTEYWGSYVVRAVYEEDWNEYIHRTCSTTSTDADGNTTTSYYDCSYVEYHPDYWWFEDNLGNRYSIDRSWYDKLCKRWHNVAKTGHHSGYTNSGDIYQTQFSAIDEEMECLTVEHTYFSKIEVSDSVFQFQNIKPEEAKVLGLFDYPSSPYLYRPVVLGSTNLHSLDVINAKLGSSCQIRLWILVFHEQPLEIALSQRDYWHNGNKNELVTCIGLKDNKVDWSYVFSWSEQDEFLIRCREAVAQQIGKPLDLEVYSSFLSKEIPSGWKRKHFRDFNYLSVHRSTTAYIVTFVLTFGVGLILPLLLLFNEDIFNEAYYPNSIRKSRRRY
jgi:hypothetical protein